MHQIYSLPAGELLVDPAEAEYSQRIPEFNACVYTSAEHTVRRPRGAINISSMQRWREPNFRLHLLSGRVTAKQKAAAMAAAVTAAANGGALGSARACALKFLRAMLRTGAPGRPTLRLALH
eukprot:6197881-Pleurochrysis_carterae.AAC.1